MSCPDPERLWDDSFKTQVQGGSDPTGVEEVGCVGSVVGPVTGRTVSQKQHITNKGST